MERLVTDPVPNRSKANRLQRKTSNSAQPAATVAAAAAAATDHTDPVLKRPKANAVIKLRSSLPGAAHAAAAGPARPAASRREVVRLRPKKPNSAVPVASATGVAAPLYTSKLSIESKTYDSAMKSTTITLNTGESITAVQHNNDPHVYECTIHPKPNLITPPE